MSRPSLRAKFLASAVKTFQTKGFKSSTIEDIADAAGAFKGSFYNHFNSKEAVAVATVELYTEVGIGMLAMKGPPSPIKRLRKHFELMAAYQRKHHFPQGCLLANFSAELADETVGLRKALNEAMKRWYKAVATVVRQAQDAGEINKRHNPDQLARYLVNAWEGTNVRVRASKSSIPVDDFFKVTFEEMLR
jgi:TetR/AcrR family transcriptional regulator, transcriptional repressor for nem operon